MKNSTLVYLFILFLISCGSDETLPFLSVSSPSSSSSYVPGDTIIVSGTAADDSEIKSVRFIIFDLSIDRSIESTDAIIFEFIDSIILDRGLSNDSFDLEITATDATGNVAMDVVSIFINSPVLVLDSISFTGAVIRPGDTIIFRGSTRDDLGIDSILIESEALSQPYINAEVSDLNYILQETVVLDNEIVKGSYVFTLTVIDSDGNKAFTEVNLAIE